jgi:DNA-binding MarR family transcriptional regulator
VTMISLGFGNGPDLREPNQLQELRQTRVDNSRVLTAGEGSMQPSRRATAIPIMLIALTMTAQAGRLALEVKTLSSEPEIYDIATYQPSNCVGQLMYRVRAAHMSALDEELARDPDLAALEVSAAQYKIISVLAKRGVDSATELCKDLSYDGGAMTRMVDRLEAKGLISRRRCPDDRRLVKLELTEDGLAALPKLRECSVRVLNRFMRGFSHAEARQLEGFLTRMLQNA